MKKKQKLFLGFVVLIIAAIITLASCEELLLGPTFPSEFRGNWVSDTQNNTLTIKVDIITDSRYNDKWELTNISGDYYDLKTDTKGVTIYMVLENGILNIGPNRDGGSFYWAGDWRKQ
jgi:hypothetical protein